MREINGEDRATSATMHRHLKTSVFNSLTVFRLFSTLIESRILVEFPFQNLFKDGEICTYLL